MAKPKFDPSQPFTALDDSTSAKPKFDPSQPFTVPGQAPAPSGDSSWLDTNIPGGTPRGYIKGALEALPTAGMIGGGLVGASGGPLTAVGGAGLGGAAGASLKNLGEKYILGEDKTRDDVYGDPAKAAVQGVGAEMGGQVLGAGIKAASEIPVVQKAMSGIGSGLAKVGETFSGVPQKEIETYAKNADQIQSMAKASDNSVPEAADQLRAKFNSSIDQTRKALNDQIGSTLKNSDQTVSVTPIVRALNDQQLKINAKLYPKEVSEIDGLIEKVKSLADDSGNLSVSDAHDVKRFLQDQASSAYRQPGVFPLGTEGAKAAKAGAAQARILVDQAEPAVAQANGKLAQLHDIEDSMNLNLVKEGKPEAALMAAGNGANPRNAMALQELGQATGTDMQGDAEKLAAMRTFGSPKLIAQDATGKAAGRMGLASGIGYLIGNVPGAVIAAGATSPAAVKLAIDGGRLGGSILGNSAGQTLMAKGLNSLATPELSKMVSSPDMPPDLQKPLATKGPDKWANDGVQNLIDHVTDPTEKSEIQNLRDQIGDDKKGRDLLIQASDLQPGSKALSKILAELQSKYGKDN